MTAVPHGPAARLRCLVADDHPALVAAVVDVLRDHGLAVVGPCADGRLAVALAARERPELALVDYRMPRLAGVELLRELHKAAPTTRVCVYTAEADAAVVAEALDAGAAAIVLKEAPLVDVVRALEAVVAGRPYVDPALAREALGTSRRPSLTARELQVLGLVADGLAYEEIGRQLGISAETVRTHLAKASDRLGATTRTQAVATAIREQLIA